MRGIGESEQERMYFEQGDHAQSFIPSVVKRVCTEAPVFRHHILRDWSDATNNKKREKREECTGSEYPSTTH